MLREYNINLGYSQQIRIGEEISVNIGAELAYLQRVLDWSKLTFGDMIDPRRGFVYSTNSVPRCGSTSGVDLSVWTLITYKSAFVGASFRHINESNMSVLCGESLLYVNFDVQAGYTWNIGQSWKVLPTVYYNRQAHFEQITGVLRGEYKGFNIGVGTRLNDGMIFTGGYATAYSRFNTATT